MEHSYPAVEFEATIDEEGVVHIPAAIASTLHKGKRYTVRIIKGSIPRSLSLRGISEDDVECMAMIQLESREDILRFLHAESSLSDNRMFRRRAGNVLRLKT